MWSATMARHFKELVREIVVFIGIILLSPLWLVVLAERRFGSKRFFAGCSEWLSLIPGRLGIYARRSYYWVTLDECAVDVHIGFGTTLAHPQVSLGRSVYIGNRCTLGMCIIDDHATIGSNIDLLSGRRQHHFELSDVPVQEQGGYFAPIHLGRNCWIGNSAVIMADVGAAAVVGAGSVVVHSVPTGAVVVGNPARVTRVRAAG
jgi:acetyltransferase-like isoleucine patch superfamily enzyme